MTSISGSENVLRSGCGTWKIEWGPGSPRPDHFMLYKAVGGHDEYMATYLTLLGAMREARRWKGRPLSWGQYECERGLQAEVHAGIPVLG